MLNELGQEIPDDTPVVIRFKGRTISKFEDVRAFIRREMSAIASQEGRETLAEANDFDVDGDPFPVSAREYSEGTEAADREALAYIQSRQEGKPEASTGGASSAAGVQPAAAPPGSSEPLAQ